MKTSKLETDGFVYWLKEKPQRKARAFIEALEPGIPGPKDIALQVDWELARKLHYKGLVRPVKPSEAWIPCMLTEAGERVREGLKA